MPRSARVINGSVVVAVSLPPSRSEYPTSRPTSADLTPATQVADELLSSVGWSIIQFAIRRRIGADRVTSLTFLGHTLCYNSALTQFVRDHLRRCSNLAASFCW